MNRLQRIGSIGTVLFALAAGGASAGDGEILYVNSFEGTGGVPQFVPVESQAGVVQRLVAIDVDTSVPSNQSGLFFSLEAAPSGLAIHAASGEISWTPGPLQVGTHPVTVRVEDLAGLTNTLSFDIEVVDPNAAPLIAPIGNRSVAVGSTLSLTVQATDADPGDIPTFSLEQAPASMTLDPVTGLLEWLPGAGEIGTYAVIVRATDMDGRFDQEEFSVEVAVNSPPVLEALADRGAAPGVETTFQPRADDPDPGDTLSWLLLDRPSGMSIDAASGQVRWTPTSLQLGPHPVTVQVRDAFGDSDQQSLEIFVDLNRPPVAFDDDGYRVERGDTLEIPAPGVLDNDTDPNSDVLSTLPVAGPERGTLALAPDGGFDYTPDVPIGTIGLTEKFSVNFPGGGGTWIPLIGNLDDDDQSELVLGRGMSTFKHSLFAVDGATGQIDWITTLDGRPFDLASKAAMADIDLDGKPEILVIGGYTDFAPSVPLQLYAFEHDGQIKWVSEELPSVFYTDGIRRSNGKLTRAAITIADLDQDGRPEILAAPDGGPAAYHVWDHQGRTLAHVEAPESAISNGSPTRVTVVDLDLDGDLEIVVGHAAWSHEGDLLWERSADFSQNADAQTYPVVANLDDDPFPELIRMRGGGNGNLRQDLVAWNHDGTSLPWELSRTPGFNTAPITVADVDADGYADILLANTQTEDLFEVIDGRDGSVKWSKSVTTRSIGATVFDMDRDGFVEVVFVDESAQVHVWDGRDGTEKLVFPTGKPRPRDYSVPVLADIDNDGAAELIIPGGGSFGTAAAVSVWESPADDWAPMRAVWNEQRYHVTNVNDDLSIPAVKRPHWLLPGLNQAMINRRLPEDRPESTDAFSYRASDGPLQSNVAEVAIEILPPNAPPRILSTPPLLASPDFEYVYSLLAVDADVGELLSFAIAAGPATMDIDVDGRVTWTPTVSDLGLRSVVVSVTDTLNVTAYQNFVIEVREELVVPDLSGLPEAAAVSALQAVTLRPDPLRDTFSDSVPVGTVAAQSPSAGTPVAAGAGVVVEISRGPLPVNAPRLVGQSLDDAQALLANAGLSGAPVDWANDPGVPRGVVLQQDPAPNARVPPGSSVELIVSGGPRASITVDPPLIPAGETASVSVEIRDVDGTPLEPQPPVTLTLAIDPGSVFGTLPTLNGASIETGIDTQGQFALEANFSVRGGESIVASVAVLPAISDGPGGSIYSEFTRQQSLFSEIILALAEAVEISDLPAIETLDQALANLEQQVDLRRMRTMTVIAPEGGVPPTPPEAQAGGLFGGNDDHRYASVGIDLISLLETIDLVVREGTAPDVVMNVLNQDLAAVGQVRATLEPSTLGVLRASPAITALLGTYAPRVLVADLRAVRQALRDEGVIGPDGAAHAGRFTLPGILSAVRIRNDIIKDFYVPYLGEVARAMGQVIAADLLQSYANAGVIAGIVTGASQSIHVFEIAPSVIEGFGFDPTLSPNNAITMIGPNLFDAVEDAASGLPSASDFKDINSVFDAIQGQIDNANAIEQAWKDANTIPNGIARGCILDGTPGCRQLIFPDGFASIYESDGGLSLPAPVLVIARNLESGSTAVFIANFVPTSPDD